MDPEEQSDLRLHCFLERLLKQFIRGQKQTTFVVIGALSLKNAEKLGAFFCNLLILNQTYIRLGYWAHTTGLLGPAQFLEFNLHNLLNQPRYS